MRFKGPVKGWVLELQCIESLRLNRVFSAQLIQMIE